MAGRRKRDGRPRALFQREGEYPLGSKGGPLEFGYLPEDGEVRVRTRLSRVLWNTAAVLVSTGLRKSPYIKRGKDVLRGEVRQFLWRGILAGLLSGSECAILLAPVVCVEGSREWGPDLSR